MFAGFSLFTFVHAYNQGNGHHPIWVAESLPFGEDNLDTLPLPIPGDELAKQYQVDNETKLDHGELQTDKVAVQDVPAGVSFPEVPPHKPIVRRAQFHTKNVIKEEKAKKKSDKEAATKGGGKKSKNQKSKSKKAAKQSKLRNSKRRAARKAKAKRTSIASKKRSNDTSDENEQPLPQVPKMEEQAHEEVGTKGNKSKGKSKQNATLKHAQVQGGGKDGQEQSGDTTVKSNAPKKRTLAPNKELSKQKATPKAKAKGKAKVDKPKAGKAKAKSKPAASHPGESKCENDALSPEIIAVLKEAKEKAKRMYTQCYVEGHPGCLSDHMEQEVPHYDDFQLSIYWTRRAVGVKMHDENLPATRGKSKTTWQQVGYFAGGTCPYVNIMLADYWVLSSKQVTICQYVNLSPFESITEILFSMSAFVPPKPFCHRPAPTFSGASLEQACRRS